IQPTPTSPIPISRFVVFHLARPHDPALCARAVACYGDAERVQGLDAATWVPALAAQELEPCAQLGVEPEREAVKEAGVGRFAEARPGLLQRPERRPLVEANDDRVL